MSERTGQTWRLFNMDGEGSVVFTVLRSQQQGATETEHEILVLEAVNFKIFEADQGRSSFWWESLTMLWDVDPLYRRIA
jgi:hypothetical protein